MPRNARDVKKDHNATPKVPASVTNERLASRCALEGPSSIPVRTVMLVEVGDMPSGQVRMIVEQMRAAQGEPLHPTFIQPVRNGKIMGDIIFEQEILTMVRKICEVVDGEIVLRDGARDVDILRAHL